MKSAFLCVLIFRIFPECESAVPALTVKRGDPAVLPCTERCAGVARWTVFHRPKDTLVRCDQTECRSMKEGYQMIYNQYLQGDFSLIITEADFSNRGRYVCDCDGKDRCDFQLLIETLNTSVQVQPGGSLLLYLDVSEPMEVIYTSTGEAEGSSGEICTVDGRSVQCKSDYTERTSVLSAVELRDMTPSDSGVYTLKDKRNEEDIHIYSVTVKDGGDGSEAHGQEDKLSRNRRSAESNCPKCECPKCECTESPAAGVLVWVVVLQVAVIAVAGIWIMRLKRENKKLQLGTENTGVQYNQNGDQRNGQVNITEQEKLNT